MRKGMWHMTATRKSYCVEVALHSGWVPNAHNTETSLLNGSAGIAVALRVFSVLVQHTCVVTVMTGGSSNLVS